MKQEIFKQKYGSQWDELELVLKEIKVNNGKCYEPEKFAELFRNVSRHLSLARDRCYSPDLVQKLNDLTLLSHQYFYRKNHFSFQSLVEFFMISFPRTVRAEKNLVWFSALLFFGPLFGTALWVYFNPNGIYSLMDPLTVASFHEMYSGDSPYVRTSDDDVLMFGHYIRNNTGIGLQCFAGGLFFCVATIFFILYNGFVIGAVAGYVTQAGYGQSFFPFVVGHGSFELTAIVLSGAAGIRLGLALIFPGNVSRAQSLKTTASRLLPMIWGFAAYFIIAAGIEAFWSPRQIAPIIRYIVGGGLWLVVLLHLSLGGRR